MKKAIILLFVSIVQIIDSQTELQFTKTQIDNFNTGSNTKQVKIVSSSAFYKIMSPIFSKVVLDDEDAIKNGTSISYVANTDKSTISFNSTIFPKKHPYTFINIGGNGKANNDFVYLKNQDNVNYGVGLNFTVSHIVNSSIFYTKEKKHELDVKLQRYKGVLYSQYIDLLKVTTYQLGQDTLSIGELLRTDSITSSKNSLQIRKLYDSLIKIMDRITRIEALKLNVSYDDLGKEIIDSLSSFEVKNAKLNGYSVWWCEYGLKPSLEGINYFDSTVVELLEVGRKNYGKLAANISLNYTHNAKRLNVYLSGGFNVYNSYYYEGATIKDFEYNSETGKHIKIKGYDQTSFESNKNYITFDPFLNFYIYPFKNKVFGFEISSDYKISDLSKTHDFKAGILFSVYDKEKDISAGTIGLFFTGTKLDYSRKTGSEFFGLGLRVGLPINKILSLK